MVQLKIATCIFLIFKENRINVVFHFLIIIQAYFVFMYIRKKLIKHEKEEYACCVPGVPGHPLKCCKWGPIFKSKIKRSVF
jgi:hypothetical protein